MGFSDHEPEVKLQALKALKGKAIRHDDEDCLWGLLSDDIVDLIFKRLSFATRCRIRCVCRRWKGLPFLASPCTLPIMSNYESNDVRVFGHCEEKWFSLPFKKDLSFGLADFTWNVIYFGGKSTRYFYHLKENWYSPFVKENLSMGLNKSSWEVMDVDAGLVCYILFEKKVSFWLLISNPVKAFARLIPPPFATERGGQMDCGRPRVKMHVDQKKMSFKIMVVIHGVKETAVYHSDENSWRLSVNNPHDFGSRNELFEFFVWRNVFYAYRVEDSVCRKDLMLAYSQGRGGCKWESVDFKFPREIICYNMLNDRFIFSLKDDVILILVCPTANPPFSVWKLLPLDMNDLPDLALSRWERVYIERDEAIEKSMEACSVGCPSYGTDQMFLFHNEGLKCFNYNFSSQTWRVLRGAAPGEIEPARKNPWEAKFAGLDTWERRFARFYPWVPSLDLEIDDK